MRPLLIGETFFSVCHFSAFYGSPEGQQYIYEPFAKSDLNCFLFCVYD